MNAIELAKFNSFVLDVQVSPFDNSSDCAIILTRNQLIIGFIAPTKPIKWTTFKEIDMDNGTTSFAISPLSRTMLMPLLVRVAYADKHGIYSLSYIEENLQNKQTMYKGNFEVTTMSYNDDGTQLAFSGYDSRCHVLVYQDDALSEPDSMVSDAVTEGSYHHCAINLTSPAVCVHWHPTRNNYLVVAECNGLIRFLVSTGGEDEKDNFICEYVINIGLKMALPLTDLDFIRQGDRASFDFIVSSSAGLFLFALDKPLATLEKLPCGAGGNDRVQMSQSWGSGSLLATVNSTAGTGQQLMVTDIDGSRIITCPMGPCVAISWHRKRPILVAASIDTIVGFEFHEIN